MLCYGPFDKVAKGAYTGNIGRTTRAGKEFSPYILPTDPLIRIETAFDIG
jgi:hypothetical protein